MQFYAPCYRCSTVDSPIVFPVAATTERWVVAKCPNGHEVGLIFQASGWAHLFERALRRVAINSPRDAVIDAYTAFDMFLAEVPARARYRSEAGASPRRLRDELKSVNTGERALGAACAVASLASGRPPPKWDTNKTTQLRNKAVHAGEYPTVAEAEELCVEVARVILEFLQILDSDCVNPGSYDGKVFGEAATLFRELHPDINPSFSSGGDIFDWSHSAQSRPSVKDKIAAYRLLPLTNV
jgi:hypothetical protein